MKFLRYAIFAFSYLCLSTTILGAAVLDPAGFDKPRLNSSSGVTSPSFYCDEILDADDMFVEPAYDASAIYKLNIIMDSRYFDNVKTQKRRLPLLSTLYTPTKSRPFCLDTPRKKQLDIRAFIVNKSGNGEHAEGKIIYTSSFAFTSGFAVFVDLGCIQTSLAVDCDQKRWLPFVEEFFANEKMYATQNDFIIDAMDFVKRHQEQFATHMIYEKQVEDKGKLVCRHLASLALPFFSHLLTDSRCPFYGYIRQMYCDVLGNSWDFADDGHVWNVLTLYEKNGQTTHWFVDILNQNFINLSAEKRISNLRCFLVVKGVAKEVKLSSDRRAWARLTKEVLNINPSTTDHLYSERNKHVRQLAADKFSAQNNVPPEWSTIETE